MNDILLQVLVGLVATIATLAMVLGVASFKLQWTTAKESHALYKAHLGDGAMDENGAPKWYVKKDLSRLVTVIADLKTALESIEREQTEIRKEIHLLRVSRNQ